MKLYLVFHDFYGFLHGVFGDLQDAIDSAEGKGNDYWIEEWTLDIAGESKVVWRAGDD